MEYYYNNYHTTLNNYLCHWIICDVHRVDLSHIVSLRQLLLQEYVYFGITCVQWSLVYNLALCR